MTYGIKVINPGVNRVILDGSNPLYVIPPIRVTGKSLDFYQEPFRDYDPTIPPFGLPYIPDSGDDWAGAHLVIRQRFTLSLQYALTSIEPPMVFISQSTPSVSPHWRISGSDRYSWMPNVKITPVGSPGRWTGVFFEIFAHSEVWSHRAAYWWREADKIISSERRVAPDLSRYFILVGHGVRPTASGFGMVVYDTSGRVTFNSDSNIAKAVGSTSRWNYNGRSGGGGFYVERWQSSQSAPTSTAYVLFSPHQKYRRYNNEIAQVAMTSAAGRPSRIIVGGRSGSPAHTPIIWIEPMKPIEYW